MRDQILKLYAEGYSYREIEKLLGCSKSTISFHCAKDGKLKANKRNNKFKKKNVLLVKSATFKKRDKRRSYPDEALVTGTFGVEELKEKIGDNPVCYLTGDPINLDDGKSYQLDHIKPLILGGDSSLENCGLCTRSANLSKSDMTYEEFLLLCQKVLINHGYKIEKIIKDQP